MKKNIVDYNFEYESNSSSDDCGNDLFQNCKIPPPKKEIQIENIKFDDFILLAAATFGNVYTWKMQAAKISIQKIEDNSKYLILKKWRKCSIW